MVLEAITRSMVTECSLSVPVCRGASKAVFADRLREFLAEENKDAKVERPVFTGNFPFKIGKFTISSLRQVRLLAYRFP